MLDIEEKKGITKIIKKLKNLDVPFYIYFTGSRGYHIHIFFKKELITEEKTKIIKSFRADPQKDGERTMIALENVPHWKTGKLKEEVKWK